MAKMTNAMEADDISNVTFNQKKCSVVAGLSGDNCPETGKHRVDNTDEYLCEKCYEKWVEFRKGSSPSPIK